LFQDQSLGKDQDDTKKTLIKTKKEVIRNTTGKVEDEEQFL
jgi:hypothetical protein